MSKFIIQGGKPLVGGVRLGGAKNASFKIMIAALLCQGKSRLLNLAKIGDVGTTAEIIRSLGAYVRPCGERTIFIDPAPFDKFQIPDKFGEISRASLLFAAPLIKKFGQAVLPLPGGDKIGKRPIERHLLGFKKMGIVSKIEKNRLYLSAPRGVHATRYRFPKNTHTGTENLIMMATVAEGTTILENAALETEIDDLIYFLNRAGAKIKRLSGRKIKIIGGLKLRAQTHAIIPDANEAVSYACAALATKGDIAIEEAKEKDLAPFLEKVKEIGGRYRANHWGIRFWWQKPIKAANITTNPFPGFKTDWQPLWTMLMTQAEGTSRVIEAIYEDRFKFVPALIKMGAKIDFFQPKVKNPEKFYNFNYKDSDPNTYHGVRVHGPTPLKGQKMVAQNLRRGATLTIAALTAQGESIIKNTEIIDRGYEDLGQKLKELGGHIKIIND